MKFLSKILTSKHHMLLQSINNIDIESVIMPPRSARTSKTQKEYLINYLEEHKILLGGKINPLELPKITSLWEHLTLELNKIGPVKSIREWKNTISELKTNTKRRARAIKYGNKGTGGGSAVKPLSDLEERLLSLLSTLTIDGASLMEGGIVTLDDPAVATTLIIVPDNNNDISTIQLEKEDVPEVSTAPIIEIVHEPEKNKYKIKTKCDRPRKKFANQGNRMLSAINAHDQQVKYLADSNYAVTRAINNLARAINAKR